MNFRRLVALLAALALIAAACGSDSDSEPTTTTETASASEPAETAAPTTAAAAVGEDSTEADRTESGEMIIQPGECGLANGEAATGDPIRIGAGATNVPGIDFTWGPKMTALYFECVNANGGIYGHPIDYTLEEAAPDPAVWQAIATKLVEEDQVLGVAGSFSLVECDVNGQYYADNGYSPIIAGVSPGCFLDDTFSAVNMGPYYSNLGAAQAVVRAGAQGKLVVASHRSAGHGLQQQLGRGHGQYRRSRLRGHSHSRADR